MKRTILDEAILDEALEEKPYTFRPNLNLKKALEESASAGHMLADRTASFREANDTLERGLKRKA